MKTRIRNLTEQEKRSLGEQQMITDWLELFPTGILSIVADTFDLWKLITEYLPANKEAIMSRDGKLVIRPDSGDPVDIICGIQNVGIYNSKFDTFEEMEREHIRLYGSCKYTKVQFKGVIELLWETFGGTVSKEGYRVLDSHSSTIYGDAINLDRQLEIYSRLADKGFAATNVVLGIGSFTYVYCTRDNLGFAAKGAWFERGDGSRYNIYKEPITDDGAKKSLSGRVCVTRVGDMWDIVEECSDAEENDGLLQVIYEDGKFFNQTTISEIRKRINESKD